jgi:hypothetical protein
MASITKILRQVFLFDDTLEVCDNNDLKTDWRARGLGRRGQVHNAKPNWDLNISDIVVRYVQVHVKTLGNKAISSSQSNPTLQSLGLALFSNMYSLVNSIHSTPHTRPSYLSPQFSWAHELYIGRSIDTSMYQ